MSALYSRRLGLLLLTLGTTVGCKPRTESGTKDLGNFDSDTTFFAGVGRNSFYGTSMKRSCIYSKFSDGTPEHPAEGPKDPTLTTYTDWATQVCKSKRGRWEAKGNVCVQVANPTGTDEKFQGYIKLVDNLGQLASVLDIDVAGRLSASGLASKVVGDFSLSPAARYFSMANQSNHSVYFVVYVKSSSGSENLLNETLFPDKIAELTEAVKSNNPARVSEVVSDFLDDCGDQYSATVNYGGEFVGIMEATVKEETDKSQLYAELSGQLTGGASLFGAKGSVKASTERLSGSFSKLQNVNIYFAQSGGNGKEFSLKSVADGFQGYQKLIENAEGFIKGFSGGKKNDASNTQFNGSVPALDPRPAGSKDGNTPIKLPGDAAAGGVGLALDGGTKATGTVTPADKDADYRVKGSVRNSNFLAYTDIQEVRSLLRKVKTPNPDPKMPQNLLQAYDTKHGDLLAYLGKYEIIKANYIKLTDLEKSMTEGKLQLASNQRAYIDKFKKIYIIWNSSMSMGSDTCKSIGSRCVIPKEENNKELNEILKSDPTVDLTSFTLPLAIPDATPKVTQPTIQNGDWAIARRPKNYSSETEQDAAVNVLTTHSYFDGMRQCRQGWRFPADTEFARLETLGFLATARMEYPRVSADIEKEDGRYNYRCFWRLDTNVKKDQASFSAYVTEAQQNGSHFVSTPPSKSCYVVCVDGKIAIPK